MKRRVHPMTALAFWLGVSVVALLLALVAALARQPSDLLLDRAHLAGMELGQQMCLGLRSELERAPVRAPVARGLGGLL